MRTRRITASRVKSWNDATLVVSFTLVGGLISVRVEGNESHFIGNRESFPEASALLASQVSSMAELNENLVHRDALAALLVGRNGKN